MCKNFFYFSLIMTTGLLASCSTSIHQPTFDQLSNISPANNQVMVARYSSISILPTNTQINPLSAISQFKFTPSVHTVGQAITQVLQGSGYALAPDNSLPVEAREVMKKPLPITQRELGPITTQDAVAVLIGQDVFVVLVDSLHRTVSFQLTPAYLKTGQDHE